MIDLTLLPDGGVGWLDASGESADIVISTRVRLARNLEGYAFSGRARDGERLRVLAQVREAMANIRTLEQGVLVRVDELPPEDRLLSEIVSAVDGPISLGDFGQPHQNGACDHEGQCVLTHLWNLAGEYMRAHLASYTLASIAEMARGKAAWPEALDFESIITRA